MTSSSVSSGLVFNSLSFFNRLSYFGLVHVTFSCRITFLGGMGTGESAVVCVDTFCSKTWVSPPTCFQSQGIVYKLNHSIWFIKGKVITVNCAMWLQCKIGFIVQWGLHWVQVGPHPPHSSEGMLQAGACNNWLIKQPLSCKVLNQVALQETG